MPSRNTDVARVDLDRASTMMIRAGVTFVKRNPIVVGSYLLGILLFLFYNGTTVPEENLQQYHDGMNKIDWNALNACEMKFRHAEHAYYTSKGWFSCDSNCQVKRGIMGDRKRELNEENKKVNREVSKLKAGLGLLSAHGISETRDTFTRYFTGGKDFAKRQTTWDALFMGISAMGRDEGLLEYLLRLLVNMLINFTLVRDLTSKPLTMT